MLSTLFVALLVGFALQAMGRTAEPVLRALGYVEKLVFRVLAMIMWVAPIGAFGAIAGVVGGAGWAALGALASVMVGFYITCALFVLIVLGLVLRLVTGLNILSLLRYLGREFLLIVATSSSESALPRLIAKMEHVGVSRPVVGITVPTGYSFNLDGTAIYLTMASLFVADEGTSVQAETCHFRPSNPATATAGGSGKGPGMGDSNRTGTSAAWSCQFRRANPITATAGGSGKGPGIGDSDTTGTSAAESCNSGALSP